jgi:outer membrane protein assembly factor BamB
VPSPLFYRDRLYLVKNGGLVSCFNATNGAASYVEQKLGAAGDYYASPVAANGKICVASRRGVLTVFEAGDVLKVLAQNDLGETTLATPAVSGHCLYVRTPDHLFAFGE